MQELFTEYLSQEGKRIVRDAMKLKLVAVILGILFITLLGYLLKVTIFSRYSPPTGSSSNTIKVAASFYPLAYFAGEIGKDKVTVTNITPAGAEPHDYEPTPQDIIHIESSKLLILNGGHFEAWADNIQRNLENKSVLIVNASEGLSTQEVLEQGERIVDPHVWLSPVHAQRIVDTITKGIIQVDVKNQDYYLANTLELDRRLQELDAAYRKGLAKCANKNFVTSHAAFGYLADTYGLHQVSIAGFSPDAEPSPREIADVADFARKNNVHYIFFESLASPKLSETIAREIGAETLVLNPIEGLSDEEIGHGKNYFTEMQQNLTNLRIALQCT